MSCRSMKASSTTTTRMAEAWEGLAAWSELPHSTAKENLFPYAASQPQRRPLPSPPYIRFPSAARRKNRIPQLLETWNYSRPVSCDSVPTST